MENAYRLGVEDGKDELPFKKTNHDVSFKRKKMKRLAK